MSVDNLMAATILLLDKLRRLLIDHVGARILKILKVLLSS